MRNNDFSLVKGVTVGNLDGIYESYQVQENKKYHIFTINVSAENIIVLLKEICKHIITPGFFVIEIPTNFDEEKILRKSDTDPFHVDVYYLDGKNNDDFQNLLQRYGNLLINDGQVKFGFGSHTSIDEVFIQKYKIFSIFTDNPDKYEKILRDFKFKKEEKIRTVWDNFTYDNPGQVNRIKINNEDIYDMVDSLKNVGLYFADRREER